jgi:hypothetical protein
MNSTNRPVRDNNYTDVAPQTIYALIEQLVKYAKVPKSNIIVYNAKRYIYSEVLKKYGQTSRMFVSCRKKNSMKPRNILLLIWLHLPILEKSGWFQRFAYIASIECDVCTSSAVPPPSNVR